VVPLGLAGGLGSLTGLGLAEELAGLSAGGGLAGEPIAERHGERVVFDGSLGGHKVSGGSGFAEGDAFLTLRGNVVKLTQGRPEVVGRNRGERTNHNG